MVEKSYLKLLFLLVCAGCTAAQELPKNCIIGVRHRKKLTWLNISTLPNDTMTCLANLQKQEVELEGYREVLMDVRNLINKRRRKRGQKILPEAEFELIPEVQECLIPMFCNGKPFWGQLFVRDPATGEVTTKCSYKVERARARFHIMEAEYKLIAHELSEELKMIPTAVSPTEDATVIGKIGSTNGVCPPSTAWGPASTMCPSTPREVTITDANYHNDASTSVEEKSSTKADHTGENDVTDKGDASTIVPAVKPSTATSTMGDLSTTVEASTATSTHRDISTTNPTEITTTFSATVEEVSKNFTLPGYCDSAMRILDGNGVVSLLRGGNIYEVYCDMATDGGNWIVFQRRMDGSVDFYRTWEEYATGFGNKTGEFWLGLETVHHLTQNGSYELRVDLTDWDGSTRYAKYGIFSISGRSDGYGLTVGGYSGNAGDSLNYHNGQQFSTKDKDLDTYSANCAASRHAAWWFGECAWSSLNGRYNDTTSSHDSGVFWYHWGNRGHYSLKAAEMKFRKK